METKEKAIGLVDKMYQHQWRKDTIEFRNAKQCALIAVDEIIKALEIEGQYYTPQSILDKIKWNETKKYWQEVKQEINNL